MPDVIDWKQLDQDREAHQTIYDLIAVGAVEVIGFDEQGTPFYVWTAKGWRWRHPWQLRLWLTIASGLLAGAVFGYYEAARMAGLL